MEINYTVETIEDFQDYWKPFSIDYQILSIYKKEHPASILYNLVVLDAYHDVLVNTQTMLQNGYLIHSVKRLSDGEIFTVGDTVHYDDTNRTTTIYGFRLDNNYRSGLCITSPIGGSEFLYIRKLTKNKLFTTEDGVDIYEGDTFYTIGSGNNKPLDFTTIKVCHEIAKVGTGQLHQASYKTKNHIWWIRFAKKENAEEFIKENKPYFSISDIKKALNENVTYQYHSTTVENLIKILKEKYGV